MTDTLESFRNRFYSGECHRIERIQAHIGYLYLFVKFYGDEIIGSIRLTTEEYNDYQNFAVSNNGYYSYQYNKQFNN